MGIPLWGDLDISIVDADMDTEKFKEDMSQFGFPLKRKIVDSRNGKPFQMVFGHHEIKDAPEIDVFFWRKIGQHYVHAYDYYMERPKGGIPSKYVFKGTPVSAMKGNPVKYTWEEIAPEVNFPMLYGTLLDIWYPGWIIPDRNFGQSRAAKEWKLKNCSNLEEKLV